MSVELSVSSNVRKRFLGGHAVLWLVFLVWSGFAATYIVKKQWRQFHAEAIAKIGEDTLRAARVAAQRDAIEQLLTLVAQCKPIDVSTETKSDQVVSVKCLQRDGSNSAAPSAAVAAPPVVP